METYNRYDFSTKWLRDDAAERCDRFTFSGRTVLDVGCMDAGVSVKLARRGYDVTAVEANANYAALAETCIARSGFDFPVHVIDAREMAGGWDNVLALSILQWYRWDEAEPMLTRLAGLAGEMIGIEIPLDQLPSPEHKFIYTWHPIRQALWRAGFPLVTRLGETERMERTLLQANRTVSGWRAETGKLTGKNEPQWLAREVATGRKGLIKVTRRRLDALRLLMERGPSLCLRGEVVAAPEPAEFPGFFIAPWLPLRPWSPTPERLAELKSALDEIHALGLVHGDIRADNLGLLPDGRQVLLDYGCLDFCGERIGFVWWDTWLPVSERRGHDVPLDPVGDWAGFHALADASGRVR